MCLATLQLLWLWESGWGRDVVIETVVVVMSKGFARKATAVDVEKKEFFLEVDVETWRAQLPERDVTLEGSRLLEG